MRPLPLDPRRYPRGHAPLVQRPVTLFALGLGRRPGDRDLGGLRAWSDERQKVGRLLEVEVFLPDGGSLTLVAEVVKVDAMPDGAPARFDVWLRHVDAPPAALARLAPVLRAEPS
jgi:hypothetical protein